MDNLSHFHLKPEEKLKRDIIHGMGFGRRMNCIFLWLRRVMHCIYELMLANKVHLFRVQTPPGKDKALFNALCDRLNSLAEKPEWYHTFGKTCTTSIVDQVNLITGRIQGCGGLCYRGTLQKLHGN